MKIKSARETIRLHPPSVGLAQPGIGSFSWVQASTPDNSDIRAPEHWYSIEIGEDCPLSCRHCVWKKKPSRDLLSADVICRHINYAAKQGMIPELASISGREPTATPAETVQIAHTLADLGTDVVLMTSGFGLTRAFSEELGHSVRYLDLSLDGDKQGHEAIRGAGAWAMTVRALEAALASNSFERIAALATISKLNLASVPGLVDFLRPYMKSDHRLSLSVGLYFGPPGDPLLLDSEDLVRLLETLSGSPVRTCVLYISCYSHLLPDLFPRLGLTLNDAVWCNGLGRCMYPLGNAKLIVLSHISTDLRVLRLSSDGYVHLSCAHLTLPQAVAHTALGDYLQSGIADIVAALDRGELGESLWPLAEDPHLCKDRECYAYCRGGERMLGAYLGTPDASDPYCCKLVKGLCQ